MGVMTMPLDTPVLDLQLRAAKGLVGQRRQELEASRRQSQQGALSAWQDLQSSQGRIGAIEAQVNNARIAAEGTGREYGFGLRTVTELLLTQAQYFQAQANLLGAQQQMRIAAYRVLAAVGRLNARHFGAERPTVRSEAELRQGAQSLVGGADRIPLEARHPIYCRFDRCRYCRRRVGGSS